MTPGVSVWKVYAPFLLCGLLLGGVLLFLRLQPSDEGVACTLEALLCPDGSAVGRSGPNCEFAPCPGAPGSEPAPVPPPSGYCASDEQCPAGSTCQAVQGATTVAPDGGLSTFTIVLGECRRREGASCDADGECQAGLLCHDRVCTAPQGGECDGPDGNCAQGFRCVQECGPPVARQDDAPPGWRCLLEEVAAQPRTCPICLASNTVIDTPDGPRGVKDVVAGTVVWSIDRYGNRVTVEVLQVSRTPVPPMHRVIHVVMSDGREVWASPDHSTLDGRRVADLRVGDSFDGSNIVAADVVPYWDSFTYDLLPAGDTGAYWANGIVLGSTLSADKR